MPEQSAPALHAALKAALARLRAAEADAVGCFAEILRRKLYRELGHASMHAYAEIELGFSRSKTFQFIQLAEAIVSLPKLSESIARREIPWTKAVSVARVASPETEQRWLTEAQRSSRRELEAKVRQSRAAARAPQKAGQAELLPATTASVLPLPSAVRFELKLAPEQHARLQALLETLRKCGHRESREELVLAALSELASEAGESSRLDSAPPYQIVVYRCEVCGGAALPDGHRCAQPGCRNTRFLEVHHRRARELGGGNAAENLVTRCSACHRLAHEQGNVLRL
jgi:hypothetical protein